MVFRRRYNFLILKSYSEVLILFCFGFVLVLFCFGFFVSFCFCFCFVYGLCLVLDFYWFCFMFWFRFRSWSWFWVWFWFWTLNLFQPKKNIPHITLSFLVSSELFHIHMCFNFLWPVTPVMTSLGHTLDYVTNTEKV